MAARSGEIAPNLDVGGKTFVVTGATSGIGRCTVKTLTERGARVVLGVRDLQRGLELARTLGPTCEARQVDLASIESIRTFSNSFGDDSVDVLVNNAGIMGVAYGHTADGFELHLGTNHLGPFALTGLLLPRITDRIVTISSQAHRHANLDLDELDTGPDAYDSSVAYNSSKLATIVFSLELDRRLRAVESPVRSIAAHPGLAHSNLLANIEPTLRMRVTRAAQRWLGQSSEAGALPTVVAATADLPGGSYVGPSGFYELRGAPTIVQPSKLAADADLGKALWRASESLTGVRYL